jgi:HEAT repeats
MRALHAIAGVSLLFAANVALAAPALSMPRDGWVSWSVAAVDGAPNWCCLDWNGNTAKSATCDLDGREQGYSNRGKGDTTNEMRIYARFNAGKLEQLRALAASCPVKTNTAIATLDGIAAEKSVAWLTGIVNEQSHAGKAEKRIASDAMAAIATHRGAFAQEALVTIARKALAVESRKNALFWLAQVRGLEGAAAVVPFMFDDADPRVREHAAFSISQTGSPLAVPSLIRQGNHDQSTKVRAQAWFWLSQTKSTAAEAAIRNAVRSDTDEEVRKQAVFALSQLPSERAVSALITVAEDKTLPMADRKQAVFWLGQSKSDAATKYFDRVLSVTATK